MLRLESQTVILLLDIIRANHAHNNRTKSMLTKRLSWSLVSTIDEKMDSTARMTYAVTIFDLKRLMNSLSETEDMVDCQQPPFVEAVVYYKPSEEQH